MTTIRTTRRPLPEPRPPEPSRSRRRSTPARWWVVADGPTSPEEAGWDTDGGARPQ